jgi:hypothetical protein
MVSDIKIDQWKSLRDEMFADKAFIKQRRLRESERKIAVKQMNDLLAKYLTNKINNADFRSVFHQKTATDWASFGLAGFSGAMFLNMLVSNIPSEKEVSRQLKTILPVPSDTDDGYQRLSHFLEYLKELVRAGIVAKRKIQADRAPFFISAWWHIQKMADWPIYYISGRKALTADEIYIPLNNQPVDDYFAFREVLLLLTDKLGLTPWEMEDLCIWREEQNTISFEGGKKTDESRATKARAKSTIELFPEDQDSENIAPDHKDTTHVEAQYNLAYLGQKLGCKIWIATNDRSKVWKSKRLGDFTLDALPVYLGVDPQVQRTIELIDVLWLKGTHQVVAAFEVEHSTSIYSGLLRMSDLVALSPNISFPLYIVTSTGRLKDVRKQLSRPTFQLLELHKRCGFFSYEELSAQVENIIKWAKEPSAIDRLAEYVPDTNEK